MPSVVEHAGMEAVERSLLIGVRGVEVVLVYFSGKWEAA